MSRWWRFNVVGLAGVAVQAAVLALLLPSGVHYLAATALAVEAAVLHNFFWHRRWTWKDRPGSGWACLRFHLTNGALSLAGNLLFMRLLVGLLALDPALANLLSIALCSVVNFVLADRLVFLASKFNVPGSSPEL